MNRLHTLVVTLGAIIGAPAISAAQSATPQSPAAEAVAAPPPIQPAVIDPNENVLGLRDGSVVHGRITDLRAGQYVIVVLPDGQSRTVAWFDIARADGPSFPGGYVSTTYAPTPNGLGTMAPMESEFLHPSTGRVPLLLESPRAQQQIGELIALGMSSSYGGTGVIGRAICNTPCTLYVPPGVFTVTAGGPQVRTVAVSIDVPANGVRVRLLTPSNGAYFGGLAALIGGGFIALGSSALYVIGAAQSSYYSPGASTPYYVGGALMTTAGLGLVVGGIALLVSSRGGVESAQPLSPAPTVTVGPIVGGLSVGVSSRF